MTLFNYSPSPAKAGFLWIYLLRFLSSFSIMLRTGSAAWLHLVRRIPPFKFL